ncbi:MAG: hydrogenase maturation protease [Dehalococcoidia bacterium]
MRHTGRKKTVVLGVGNPLMGDDGIGSHVARELNRRTGAMPDIDVFEAVTSPMSVVHIIANYERVIIIDSARMGRNPADMCRFSPEEVFSLKSLPGISLHEGDLLRSLEISRMLGECPEDVVILGIEPGGISFGEHISSPLENRIGEYVEAVLAEIGGELGSIDGQQVQNQA